MSRKRHHERKPARLRRPRVDNTDPAIVDRRLRERPSREGTVQDDYYDSAAYFDQDEAPWADVDDDPEAELDAEHWMRRGER